MSDGPDLSPIDSAEPQRPASSKAFAALWRAAFETYYDCFFNEVVADRLVTLWQWVDDVTKVLVAVTASGSALSGWTLWNQPGYKAVWISFAGLAALLAIVHTTLTVSHRIRDWGEIKRAFSSLRIELETFRYRMQFDGDVADRDLQRDFLQYRRRYMEVVQRLRNDSLLSQRLQVAAQADVDRRLKEDESGDTHGD